MALPPILGQVDPNRGTCLDNDTGILINHAYGLADMKVSSKPLGFGRCLWCF